MIANPVSGKGRAEALGRAVQERLVAQGHGVTFAVTHGARHGTELARGAAESGHDVVAAAGGDGTVSECAAGLVGSGCRLALLPGGTGNDLARALSLPRDAERLAAAIHAGKTHRLDAWQLNDRILVNVAGVGFDAEVAARMGASERRMGGTPGYVLATLTTLWSYRPRAIRMSVDGVAFSGRVMMVALANAPYYGGGMKIAPDADPADGLLDVIVIQEVSRLQFLAQFPRVFRGTHLAHPAVKSYRGQTITIEGDTDTPIMVDGEPSGRLPIRISPTHTPLSVIVP